MPAKRNKYNIQYIIGVYNNHDMKCKYLNVPSWNRPLYGTKVNTARRFKTIKAAEAERTILLGKKKQGIIFISKCFCKGTTFKGLTKINKLQVISHMINDL